MLEIPKSTNAKSETSISAKEKSKTDPSEDDKEETAKFSKAGQKLIIRVIIALGVIDGILYFIYVSGGVVDPTLWGYLGSNQFALTTTGLLIPIIAAFINEEFEIGRSARTRIQKETDLRREQAQKERDEKHKQRIECIETTSKAYLRLFELVTDVQYAGDEVKIKEALKNLQNFIGPTESSVHLLRVCFSELLHKDDLNIFVKSINFLLCSAATTARSMMNVFTENSDPKERIRIIKQYKDELEIIRSLVRRIFYYPFLGVLQYADQIMTNISDEIAVKKKDNNEKKESDTKNLHQMQKEYKEKIMEIIKKHDEGNPPYSKFEVLSSEENGKEDLIKILANLIIIMRKWISEINGELEGHSDFQQFKDKVKFLGDDPLVPLSKLSIEGPQDGHQKFQDLCNEDKWDYNKRAALLIEDYSATCIHNLADWASIEDFAQILRNISSEKPEGSTGKAMQNESK